MMKMLLGSFYCTMSEPMEGH